jgi:hypothetical protein
MYQDRPSGFSEMLLLDLESQKSIQTTRALQWHNTSTKWLFSFYRHYSPAFCLFAVCGAPEWALRILDRFRDAVAAFLLLVMRPRTPILIVLLCSFLLLSAGDASSNLR